MAKVIYETDELRYEIQMWCPEDSYTEVEAWHWEPQRRLNDGNWAIELAQILRAENTLEKYRVVDTFADEEGE